MPDAVALMGVFLLWASVLWLPLMIYRGVTSRGKAQIWQISAILSFGLVFMGYTRAMSTGTVMEAFAWSIAWIMPIGITFFVRFAEDVPLKTWDKWLAAAAALTFLTAAGYLPGLLRGMADLVW